jgi:hypothetical protein
MPTNSGRSWWPGLQTAEATTSAGAPSFAYFAKGGYDDGIHNGGVNGEELRRQPTPSVPLRAGSCKKRKDGAPSVEMVQGKDGPLPLVIAVGKQVAAWKENSGLLFIEGRRINSSSNGEGCPEER